MFITPLQKKYPKIDDGTPKWHNPIMALMVIVLILSILPFIYTGTFSRYQADDYCFSSSLIQNGYLGALKDSYQTWSNRFSTILVIGLIDHRNAGWVIPVNTGTKKTNGMEDRTDRILHSGGHDHIFYHLHSTRPVPVILLAIRLDHIYPSGCHSAIPAYIDIEGRPSCNGSQDVLIDGRKHIFTCITEWWFF
jgi:hypothetical protein